MRIDSSNLLLAAQVQTQRPSPANPAQKAGFQQPDPAQSPSAAGRKPAASAGVITRPGTHLDIKV